MAVAYRTVASTTGVDTTVEGSLTGTSTGDLMIAFISMASATTTVTLAATGWTLQEADPNPADFSCLCYIRVKQVGDLDPVWTMSAAGNWTCDMVSFSGVAATPVNVDIGEIVAAANAIVLGPITPTVNNAMLVGWACIDATGAARTWTQTAGMTEIRDQLNGEMHRSCAYELLVGGNGVAQSRTFTATGTTQDIAGFLLAVAPGSSAVSDTRQLAYDIENAVSATRQLAYDIENAVSATRQLVYDIENAVSATRVVAYDIKADVSATRQLAYDIENVVSATRQLMYDIALLAAVSDTRQLVYDIEQSVSATRELVYDIEASVSATRDLAYDIEQSVSATRQVAYDIEAAVSDTRALSYDIEQSISATRQLSYNIVVAVSDTRQLAYDLEVGVSATREVLYEIEAAVSATRVLAYDIEAGVSATRELSYTIIAQVTGERVLAYDIGEELGTMRLRTLMGVGQ